MAKRTCSANDCEKEAAARGLCIKHYRRAQRSGKLPPRIRPKFRTDEDRFWSRVERTDECWLWTGALAHGYGIFSLNNTAVSAHRFSYELVNGPVPEGLVIDHRCRTPNCVNPDHLRAGEMKQNNENKTVQANNRCGVLGANSHQSRYRARVTHYGEQHYLGMFDSAAEAGEAARLKRLELFTFNDLDRS